MSININSFLDKVRKIIKTHEFGGIGKYQRWTWQYPPYMQPLGLNEYGCADAANILYTIGEFPSDPEERAQWIEVLQSFQDPETGMFHEETHVPIHTTAHVASALELFDARPKYPLKDLQKHATPDGIRAFMDEVDFEINPWGSSHNGAGIFAAMTVCGEVDKEWKDAYFDWLWENADPKTGMWKKGAIDRSEASITRHMAGTFHYVFNHEYEHKPLRYPEKMIDTCIKMYEDGFDETVHMFDRAGFIQVDWVYCVTRAMRQTPHRFYECKKLLEEFAVRYFKFLENADADTDESLNDLHLLFGTMCCLAELQQALPGFVISDKPLKLVLDRRPFI